jgi:hypothetical protein
MHLTHGVMREGGSTPEQGYRPLLPENECMTIRNGTIGVAAAMKAGDDQEGTGFNEEKERLGKCLRARSTKSLKDGGESPRIASHASNDAVDFGAEATA